MINGLEGIPRSGKSYEAVVYHVLPALQSGRKVITNLPLVLEMFAAIDPSYPSLIEIRRRPRPILGVWNPDALDDKGNGNAFQPYPEGDERATQRPPEGVSVFGHVWDYYSTWKHPETGRGPVFIIDEVHVALPAVGTDKHVVEWYKLHGHFNADVLLITQSFRDINQPIARLMAMLIRTRKADILGKKDHYIRKVHAGYRQAVISQEERPYKPQYFQLYKSHTQGNSVAESSASDVAPLSVKLRRFTWGFWIFTACFCAWVFWPADKAPAPKPKTPKPVAQHAPAVAPHAPPAAIKPALHTVDPKPASAPPEPDSDATPEPYGTKALHLTGRITMRGVDVYTFAISNGGQRIATVDSRDLEKMGYKWTPLTDCAGTLRWEGKPKAITCDAPILAQQGGQDRPHVIEAAQGRTYTAPGSAGPVTTRPMPEFHPPDPSQITQADLTAALRVRNPAYATGRGNVP